MSYGSCDNRRDHERQAERDFERRGRPDREDYDHRGDACQRVYADTYDRLEQEQRDEERCQEEREQERQAEERAHERRMEERRQEDAEMEEQERRAMEEQAEAEAEAAPMAVNEPGPGEELPF